MSRVGLYRHLGAILWQCHLLRGSFVHRWPSGLPYLHIWVQWSFSALSQHLVLINCAFVEVYGTAVLRKHILQCSHRTPLLRNSLHLYSRCILKHNLVLLD